MNGTYRYAQDTSVSVAKSKAEIEDLLLRYGATSFASAQGKGLAQVMFEANGRRIIFDLKIPSMDDYATRVVRGRKVKATPEQQMQAWEQACRQRWRALALVIKAKLEAVAVGITEFEDEFLAHIVIPGTRGETVGRWLRPQLEQTYQTGKMPPLLGAGTP